MSDKADAARATLAAAGLDPAAIEAGTISPQDLGRALASPDGDAIARATAELGTAATAAFLRSIEPALETRPATKAVRRALRRLEQRGIPVPPPVPRPAKQPLGATERSGLVTAVDGRGDRLIWLTREPPSGAMLLVAAQVNEPGGLVDLRVTEVTRRQMREARARLREESGLAMVAAPFEALDALIFEAFERRSSDDRRLDYARVRGRLTVEPVTPATELVSTRTAPPAPNEIEALAAQSATLLEQRELASWFPDPAAAQRALASVDQIDSSPIVLSEAAQQQRLAEVLRTASTELYPAAVTARRLEATAFVLAETDRTDAARIALATAVVLRAHPERVPDVALIAKLTNQGLGGLLAAQRSQQTDTRRDSLVLTPAEVRARSSSRQRRTPG